MLMFLWIILGIVFLLQIILSMLQMKHFSKEFVKLKKMGPVVIGRKSGGFFAGAIVLFLIDDDGIIKKSKFMEGVSCLARFKDLQGFKGKQVANLKESDGPDKHRNLKKAIADAAKNYNRFQNGEIIEDIPTPAKKLTNFIARRIKN